MRNSKQIKCLFSIMSLLLSAYLLIGCSNYSPVPYGPGPWGPRGPYFPQGRTQNNYIFLSSDSLISLRDTEAYGRFLEEVMSLCRHNRNTGFIWEWRSGGSFGSPTSSCDWATQSYTDFAVDLYLDVNPQQGSRVDMVFWVGSRDTGYYQSETSWLPSPELAGELRFHENDGFRIVYRPDISKPSIILRFDGHNISHLTGRNAGQTLSATIKYEDTLGQGSFSIVEDDFYYDDPYYSQYHNGYNQYHNGYNQHHNGYNQYHNGYNQYHNGYNQYNNGYNHYNNGYYR